MPVVIPNTDYSKQLSSMRYWLQGRQFYIALKAFQFAQNYHSGLRKDNISPEFSHQMFIANYARTILAGITYPEETLATIFLHDICEDYDVTYEEINHRFGPKVAIAVELLTKKKDGIKIPDQIYYENMAKDTIASIAKGLDRAHNIYSMSAAGWTFEKQRDYLNQVFTLVLPMLKSARREFVEQEPAYENVRSLLVIQATHIKLALNHMRQLNQLDDETTGFAPAPLV